MLFGVKDWYPKNLATIEVIIDWDWYAPGYCELVSLPRPSWGPRVVGYWHFSKVWGQPHWSKGQDLTDSDSPLVKRLVEHILDVGSDSNLPLCAAVFAFANVSLPAPISVQKHVLLPWGMADVLDVDTLNASDSIYGYSPSVIAETLSKIPGARRFS